MTNAEARCNKSLRPRKPEGSLGRTAQDVHLDSHTAPDDDDELMLNVLRCHLTYYGQVVTNAEARFNNSLRPRKPEGSLGRTAQDVHLDSHTAPELWTQLLLLLSWCLMSSDVIWHIRDKLWPMPKHGSIRKVYACLAVTCHLHFWQNNRDFLRATVVTRGWNGYRNKSQHRKSTLEKKILPPFQQGFEPATFQSRVRRSNHWAIPAPLHSFWTSTQLLTP